MAKKAKEALQGRIENRDMKLAALNTAMEHIHKDFGSGAIMRLGDDAVEDVEVIPSGSISLDAALGVGGFRADVSSRSTAPNRLVRPRWPSTP